MDDYGTRYTDREIARLERRLVEVYTEASKDLEAKIQDFTRRYKVKEAKYLEQVNKGEITWDDFKAWQRGQVFQGKQWQLKREEIKSVLYDANSQAMRIVKGRGIEVFKTNANFMNYSVEQKAGVNFGFGLYDTDTIERLVKDDPQLLPKWKINKKKDYIWNQKKVNNAVTQGILQGERLDQITKRLSTGLAARNENLMKTFARTAMTGAQNAGRQISLNDAQSKGIRVKKEWMATLDEHTRYTHRILDGQKVWVDQPFLADGYPIMFPGDPEAHPSMTYNCRCTLVGDVEDYPSEYQRYDNIDGKPIANMTYQEWYNAKKGITTIGSFQARLGAARTVQEVNDLMNVQEWFKTFNLMGTETRSMADLNGCDLDSAKSIAASYDQVFEKFPQLKGRFNAPNAHPIGMGPDTYAWCFIRNGGTVQVNPDLYNNWAKVTESYERDVLSRWHPIGTTAESIVTHEIGHAIDGLLASEEILGGYTASGEFRYASSSLKTTIMKRVAKTDPDLADLMELDKWLKDTSAVQNYVSRYAAKNPREWFAECFAEYITSANPRAVAAEFGKELEKLVARLEK